MSTTRIDFMPKRCPGGWTVVRREGSRSTGYVDHETDAGRTLTMHQAQATADAFRRDRARHGELHARSA